jgi:hypothetical protein
MTAANAAAAIVVVRRHRVALALQGNGAMEIARVGQAVTADPEVRHKVAKTAATAPEAQDSALAGDASNAIRASGVNRLHHCQKSASRCCPMIKASNRWRGR